MTVRDPGAGGGPQGVGIKICGLTRAPDAEFAEAAGADYLGVVLAEGFGRSVSASVAVRVLASVRGAVRVTVRVDDPYDRIMSEAESLRAGVVQLHGDESPEDAARIRRGGFRVWKAVKVRGGEDVTTAMSRFAGAVDGLLLDGWHPEAVGGTGTNFDWRDVAAVLPQIPEELVLVAAGGLTSTNVGEAVRLLGPDIVDVSSGVESTPGEKDLEKVRAFVEAVRLAKSPVR